MGAVLPVGGEANTGRSGLAVTEDADPGPDVDTDIEAEPDNVELSRGAVAAMTVDLSVSDSIA